MTRWMNEKYKSQKPEDGTTTVALPHLKVEYNIQCLCWGNTWVYV